MKPNMATNMFHGLRVIDYIMTYTWEEVPRGVKEINEREWQVDWNGTRGLHSPKPPAVWPDIEGQRQKDGK